MRVVLALVAVLLCANVARAHEFGVMRVNLAPREGFVEVRVELDPDLLTSPARAIALAAREGGRKERSELAIAFAGAARLAFAGKAAELEILEPIPQASLPADVIPMRFRAAIGPGPAEWSHAWASDTYALSVDRSGVEREFQWVEGRSASTPIDLGHAGAASLVRVVGEYIGLGYEHIVPKGLDHILFVLGLFLLSSRPRAILSQTLAFTAAHSITLALAVLGLVRLSPAIVEPLIALSIAFVAVENILVRDDSGRRLSRRTALVFGFGLLHGLGFAGVLADLGLPSGQVIPALAAFNVGVELGQLTVVAAAFAAVGIWFGAKPWYRVRVAIPASAALALVGLTWTVERGLL